jgi:hypothetical protein
MGPVRNILYRAMLQALHGDKKIVVEYDILFCCN